MIMLSQYFFWATILSRNSLSTAKEITWEGTDRLPNFLVNGQCLIIMVSLRPHGNRCPIHFDYGCHRW